MEELKQYEKCENLWIFDKDTKKRIRTKYTCPEFGVINRWHITEKIDGMNMRVIWDGKKVEFRGRTDRAQLSQDLVDYLTERFTVEAFDNRPPCILFGEGYGAGIQKGSRYSDTKKFALFDVWELGAEKWMHFDYLPFVAESFNVPLVPVLGVNGTIEEIVRYMETKPTSLIADDSALLMEGVVANTSIPLFNKWGSRIKFKLKLRDM